MSEADENGTSVEDATVTVRWIDSAGGLWPCERERDIFNRAYNTALEEAAKVAEGMFTNDVKGNTFIQTSVAFPPGATYVRDLIVRAIRALNNEGKG